MNTNQIKQIKENYQPGVRIRLLSMKAGPQMPEGLIGKVTSVDDNGQINVAWKNGSTLALNCETDEFIAFNGPVSSVYLKEIGLLNKDVKIWFRENPDNFVVTEIDSSRLLLGLDRYMDMIVKTTQNLAVITLIPYETETIYHAFLSAHVLTDAEAREIKHKEEFSANESEEGKCPKCGNSNINYEGTAEVEDSSCVRWQWECTACGSSGHEIGTVTFDGHIVDSSPDFEYEGGSQ